MFDRDFLETKTVPGRLTEKAAWRQICFKIMAKVHFRWAACLCLFIRYVTRILYCTYKHIWVYDENKFWCLIAYEHTSFSV